MVSYSLSTKVEPILSEANYRALDVPNNDGSYTQLLFNEMKVTPVGPNHN